MPRNRKSALMRAAENGDVDEVFRILNGRHGYFINGGDEYGTTPLHYAAYEGHWDVIELLVSWGASKKVVNNNGRTPWNVADPSVKHLLTW